ncbi:DNA-processing protein DprA [Patescibacteria group bacterium]|nr:DNA-processing protein DprA [Patescibacteria group bacterium]
MDQSIYAHFLNLVPQVGAVKARILADYFKSFKKIYQASYEELLKSKIAEKDAQRIILAKENVNLTEEAAMLKTKEIKMVDYLNDDYPTLLKEISDPPMLLYYFGTLSRDCSKNIAIVGTRNCTEYGLKNTHDFANAMAKNDLVIVSGLALGIDACAHQASINNKSKTIAVLGSGLLHIAPASNFRMSQEILRYGGAIVSEFPPDLEPSPGLYPRRNRVVAGLSKAVLITEAPRRSGALITAFLALEQNRDVLAIPGDIDRLKSIGANHLIRLGAKAVLEPDDVLEEFSIKINSPSNSEISYKPQNVEEAQIIELLKKSPLSAEALNQVLDLGIMTLNRNLSLLEIKSVLRRDAGGRYELDRK